jgi:hypothetical protein
MAVTLCDGSPRARLELPATRAGSPFVRRCRQHGRAFAQDQHTVHRRPSGPDKKARPNLRCTNEASGPTALTTTLMFSSEYRLAPSPTKKAGISV